ncbi:alpha/beta fold hydrolase [Novosphingobium rosa]|uniref:alpha/beta fold hydrolase n=1 Tax=Novosphingobium rosa TaxID=76978 RepID=UPI000830566F|nr:alpha/beta hydrolase [Novosphingobium rosa]
MPLPRRLRFLLPLALIGGGMAQPACAQPAAATAPQAPWLTIAQLRHLYADPVSRFMTIKGLEIHYKDEGPRNAPVLFMVHGSVSSLRTWDGVAAQLKQRYRIIRYDIPGYGLSGRISDEAERTVQPVEVAEGLLDALHVSKVTFVGVSSGGTMGMYLAARRPDLVTRLVLSNTPSDPVDTSHLVMPKAFLDAQARAKGHGGYQDQIFWDQFLTFFAGHGDRISPQTRREYHDFNRRTPEAHPIAMMARIGDGKQADLEMNKVTAPTLLLWGGADPLLPESAALALVRHMPNARISRLIMPDVGHYPPLEVPARFARLLSDYIEQVTPELGGTPAR